MRRALAIDGTIEPDAPPKPSPASAPRRQQTLSVRPPAGSIEITTFGDSYRRFLDPTGHEWFTPHGVQP